MGSETAADYVNSYYLASARLLPPFAPLQGEISADVCVLGGGIAGCSAALALAERGYRVVLLEARRLGWGASGRSGGQVICGLAAEQDHIEALVGEADARRIWELSLTGIALLKQRIGRFGIDCDWVDGQMLVAIKPRQWRALQAWQAELVGKYGYASTRLMAREELLSVLGSQRYVGALFDANGGHLHPLRYTLGLARAAQSAGARIHECSAVLNWSAHNGRLRVRTDAGMVDCAQLVLAGNAWLGSTAPILQRKLMSVGTYIIATEPLGEQRARELIANNAGVCDTNWILDYFRCSSDHRLLFGGRVNYSGVDLRAIGPATAQRLRKVFPQLAGTRIEYAWSCHLDITLNRAPHFGRLERNVYFLQGFSGHGISLAGIAGELAAEAIAGLNERFDVFARIPHHEFPGGMALRRPALALAMLWYRLRDLL
ncbi:MAG TPA: FAD-binding oxidoreductase [Steroidobacteraceae bacterium]|jgi:gamma-glutamylputrescine oxidase